MIKIDELREFRPTYRFEDGASISLEAVQNALTAEAEKHGVPIAFYADQVKSGGLFNKQIEDCLVMYHPEHRYDYFTFCIRVQHQGSMAYVAVNDFGSSKQMDKFARAEFAKQDRKGKDMSYKIGSMIGSAFETSARASRNWRKSRTTTGLSSTFWIRSLHNITSHPPVSLGKARFLVYRGLPFLFHPTIQKRG